MGAVESDSKSKDNKLQEFFTGTLQSRDDPCQGVPDLRELLEIGDTSNTQDITAEISVEIESLLKACLSPDLMK